MCFLSCRDYYAGATYTITVVVFVIFIIASGLHSFILDDALHFGGITERLRNEFHGGNILGLGSRGRWLKAQDVALDNPIVAALGQQRRGRAA